MDELEFTLNGQRRTLTRGRVIEALKGQTPGRIETYAVEIEGVRWPVKQVLASAVRVPATDFVSTQARSVLARMGFKVINVELEDETGSGGANALTTERALALAVQLHAGRADAEDQAVIRTAETFLGWLDQATPTR